MVRSVSGKVMLLMSSLFSKALKPMDETSAPPSVAGTVSSDAVPL